MDPFNSPAFMPHGHCYFWNPLLLGLHTISDIIIAISYYSIPLALAIFVHKRQDLQFKGIFLLFSTFIFACGTTHWMDILTTWKPYYWFEGFIKFLTAIVSLFTAFVLWPLIPKAVKLPSPAQLEKANEDLKDEILQREAREQEIAALNQNLEKRIQERTQELEVRTQEAEVANEAKSRFLAAVSHELRTPLNAIIGFADLLQEDVATLSPEEQVKDLKRISTAAHHLLTLINGILDLSKMASQELQVYFEPFEVRPVLKTITEMVVPLAEKNHNTTQIEIELPEDFSLNSDAQRLQQILLNLLSNAHKFTHQGQVFLRLKLTDQHLQIEVQDNGIGMSEESVKHIFEAFYQADNSYSRAYQGTGLGLSLVHHMVELLQGQIEVKSSLQQGSLFRVLLPLKPDLEQPTSSAAFELGQQTS